MKNYYLIKVKREHWKKAESIIFNNLIDRAELVGLYKILAMHKDNLNYYFVIGGEQHSCKVVLGNFKNRASKLGIPCKLFSSDTANIDGLSDLIWLMDNNDLGAVVKSYINDGTTKNHLIELTNKFLTDKKLMSNFILCKNKYHGEYPGDTSNISSKSKKKSCEGYCEAVELTSVKGKYRCSFCGAEVEIDGPLITGKANISHLSAVEQLHLIGLHNGKNSDTEVEKTEEKEESFSGEQIMWNQLRKKKGKSKEKQKAKGTCRQNKLKRGAFLTLLKDSNIICASEIEEIHVEQLSWAF